MNSAVSPELPPWFVFLSDFNLLGTLKSIILLQLRADRRVLGGDSRALDKVWFYSDVGRQLFPEQHQVHEII